MRRRRVGTRKAFQDSDLKWYKQRRIVLQIAKMSDTARIVKMVAGDFYDGRLGLLKREMAFDP